MVKASRSKLQKALTLALLAISSSCGVADPEDPGRCGVITNADNIAPSMDTQGKPWTFTVSPDAVNIQCGTPQARGVTQIVGKVVDGAESPVAGVSVGASLPQGSGLELVTEENLEAVRAAVAASASFSFELIATDTATDECGVAIFTIVYTCPSQSGLSVGGPFVGFSGSLFSNQSQIRLQLDIPE